MYSVSQRPHLRHLCEPLGGTEGLIETVGFVRLLSVCDDEHVRIPAGGEFQTEGGSGSQLVKLHFCFVWFSFSWVLFFGIIYLFNKNVEYITDTMSYTLYSAPLNVFCLR